MKHTTLIRSVVGLAVLSSFGLVSAQSNGPQGFSLRAGAYFPRSSGDRSTFAAGLDYKFSAIPAPQARGNYASYFGFSADYYGRTDDWNLPLAATYNARANQFVFSAGVGVDFSRRFGDSQTGMGAQIGVTYEFWNSSQKSGTGAPIFLQAKYFFAHESNLSGIAVYVGVRF